MEEVDLPPFVVAERDALLIEIEEAFSGVSRAGGVSWSEAKVIDAYGSDKERRIARAKDRDTSWRDLVSDPDWDAWQQWAFLDAKGFRYYLPAAMVMSIRDGYDSGILYSLEPSRSEGPAAADPRWLLLDLRQRLCVRRFLQYMAVVSAWNDARANDQSLTHEFFAALEADWWRGPQGVLKEAPGSSTRQPGSKRKRKRS